MAKVTRLEKKFLLEKIDKMWKKADTLATENRSKAKELVGVSHGGWEAARCECRAEGYTWTCDQLRELYSLIKNEWLKL